MQTVNVTSGQLSVHSNKITHNSLISVAHRYIHFSEYKEDEVYYVITILVIRRIRFSAASYYNCTVNSECQLLYILHTLYYMIINYIIINCII